MGPSDSGTRPQSLHSESAKGRQSRVGIGPACQPIPLRCAAKIGPVTCGLARQHEWSPSNDESRRCPRALSPLSDPKCSRGELLQVPFDIGTQFLQMLQRRRSARMLGPRQPGCWYMLLEIYSEPSSIFHVTGVSILDKPYELTEYETCPIATRESPDDYGVSYLAVHSSNSSSNSLPLLETHHFHETQQHPPVLTDVSLFFVGVLSVEIIPHTPFFFVRNASLFDAGARRQAIASPTRQSQSRDPSPDD